MLGNVLGLFEYTKLGMYEFDGGADEEVSAVTVATVTTAPTPLVSSLSDIAVVRSVGVISSLKTSAVEQLLSRKSPFIPLKHDHETNISIVRVSVSSCKERATPARRFTLRTRTRDAVEEHPSFLSELYASLKISSITVPL